MQGATATTSDDMGGLCNVQFGPDGTMPGYAVLWNDGASDREQFDSMRAMLATEDMAKVDGGPGSETWGAVNTEAGSAHVYVWVDGEGTWDLTFIPATSDEPTQANVDALVELGRKLVDA